MKNDLAIFGGAKVRNTPLVPRKTIYEEELRRVNSVMVSDNLSGFVGGPGKHFYGGKEILNFEDNWSNHFCFKNSISTNSWTTGLQTIVQSLCLDPGDEVIVPPYTMSACSSVVLLNNLIPIFADIDHRRLTIDPSSIEEKITPRTRAIMVVHLLGLPADMDSILQIAKKYDLFVIEDCAQSPGAKYKGSNVGNIGNIGGFSLNFHKHIHCGEGGVITTDDQLLADRCRKIRNHGENTADESDSLIGIVGSNYRLSEIHAAIADVQLTRLNSILFQRRKNAKLIRESLSNLEGITFQNYEESTEHSYYMFPIFFDENLVGCSRNSFLQAVNAELPHPVSWDTTPLSEGYVKPLYLNPIFIKKIGFNKMNFPFNLTKTEYKLGDCPVTENLYEKSLLLTPLVHEQSGEDVLDSLISSILKVYKNREHLNKLILKNKIFDPLEALNQNESNK